MLFAAVICVLVTGGAVLPVLARQEDIANDGFTQTFYMERCTWSTTGQNLFFSLNPGTRLVHEGDEDGEEARLITTVFDKTKQVAGVPTRVIEERHYVNGELFEVSRNFYSLCRENNSVFYFGEEVDFYEDGQIIGHEGAWLAGVNGAKPGLYMPGLPLLGARYYQEIAPDAALDRAEIVSVTAAADVPAGSFEQCIETLETTPLEPGSESIKVYCPDVGIVDDDGLVLVRYNAGRPGRWLGR